METCLGDDALVERGAGEKGPPREMSPRTGKGRVSHQVLPGGGEKDPRSNQTRKSHAQCHALTAAVG
jgi:hypothetical protein